jgi:large subunit ribosomal protein L9
MSTEIILTRSLEPLGQEGDTVTVADGYARNYLIPQGLAVPATPANLRRQEALRKKREAEQTARSDQSRRLAKHLAGHSCTITAAAGPDGRLFGSVTAADIAEALRADGVTVDRRQILLERSLRELGVYEVLVRLSPEQETKLKVWIVSNEGDAPGKADPPQSAGSGPEAETPTGN